MKRLLLAAALGLSLSATAAAHERGHHFNSCGVDSNYSVSFEQGGLLFARDEGKPGRVLMRKGHLEIDGRELALSDADRARVAEFEATVRALVPQAKAIARDAVDIAYTAVSEVAATFSKTADNSATRHRLEGLRDEFKQRLNDSFDRRPWSEDEFEKLFEQAMSDLMPVIIGEVAGTAIAIALSGDEAGAAELEKRASKLEQDIEKRIDTQTVQLAARVAALCPMVASLNRIESGLELRLDEGRRLDLFDMQD
ncbi:hypothetical protein DFR29_11891 [Tahibacter aquaticus]|uniref:DUF2884 family protein n=1 Tax=Tahibacter aquaticus TaxID=520092 RepID=A0A4R6YN35_9GAMM|nr:DUF2884 family protein [Tahibacter aquaticus]TDR38948.1 hypothetical protein DFR29_11891 [Tahibacter aquaticus]